MSTMPVVGGMTNSALVDFASKSIAELTHPTAQACALIACDNLKTLGPVLLKASGIEPDVPNRWDLIADNVFAAWGKADAEPDSVGRELNVRRLGYFLRASKLRALEARALHDKPLMDPLARLWIALAPGARSLRETIDRIKLWEPDETRMFSDVVDEKSGEDYFMSHLVPRKLWENAVFIEWVERDIPPDIREELHRTLCGLRGDAS